MNELVIEALKVACEESVEALKEVDEMVRENSIENEQWILYWQDKLNEISIK